ncbi:hypothetical protein, partial [Sunxiuqinia dokdonensis]|uniref:hypothetical protein n=1 Tax=Sunxiuqinia dokdonensis TaxID=1409788 RepID=UPI00195556BA
MIRSMQSKPIDQVLPVLGFNGDYLVSNNLDMGFGLKLQLPELLSQSAGQLYMLHDTFRRVVNLLPAGALLHKQDFFLSDRFDSSDNEKTVSLNEAYLDHFTGRPFLRHECYLYVSLLNHGLLKNYLGSALIFSRKARMAEIRLTDKLRELQNNLAAVLVQSGMDCEPIKQETAIGGVRTPGLIDGLRSEEKKSEKKTRG